MLLGLELQGGPVTKGFASASADMAAPRGRKPFKGRESKYSHKDEQRKSKEEEVDRGGNIRSYFESTFFAIGLSVAARIRWVLFIKHDNCVDDGVAGAPW